MMLHKHMRTTNDPDTLRNSFWELADLSKTTEKFKIDKNLQYLKVAPLNILKKIFIQYRFFTQYYITDLAILISKLPLGELRSILAEILYEELGDGKSLNSHPELYDNFLRSLGLTQNEIHIADQHCIQYLKDIQDSLIKNSWGYGVGLRGMGGECLCQIYLSTMHENFSMNPEIIKIQNTIEWKFWEIHIGEEDLHHQRIVRQAIDDLILTRPDTASDLINGYVESITAWEHYWSRIFNTARDIQINARAS